MWLDNVKPDETPSTPENPVELTTSELMWLLGHKNTRTTISWCNRQKVRAHYRRAGVRGENVYYKHEAETALANMPGQGAGGGAHKHKKRQKDKAPE